MFSPAGIIIYKGASLAVKESIYELICSVRADAQDDDLHRIRVLDNETRSFPNSIRKRCRIHQSGESLLGLIDTSSFITSNGI
jgi:hypothetical protein